MDLLSCNLSELGKRITDNETEYTKLDNFVTDTKGTKIDKQLKNKISIGRSLLVDYMKLYNFFSDVRFLKEGFIYLKQIIDIFPDNHHFYIRDKVKIFIYEILYSLSLGDYNNVRSTLKKFENHLNNHEELRKKFSETYELSVYLFQSFVISDKQRPVYISGNMRLGVCGYEFFEIKHNNECDIDFTTTDAIVLSNSPFQINYSNKNVDSIRFCQSFEFENPPKKHNSIRRFVYGKEDVMTITGGIEECIKNASDTDIILMYLNGDSISYLYDDTIEYGIKLGEVSPDSKSNYEENKTIRECEENFCLEDVLWVNSLSTELSESPFVFIIDCGDSNAFYALNKKRTAPLLLFLSPEKYPANSNYNIGYGKLFTLFMTCPRRAFYQICEAEMSKENWSVITELLNRYMILAARWMGQHIVKYPNLKPFLTDVICRNYFLKYLFCAGSLRLHREFSMEHYLPMSNFKELEMKILELPNLEEIIYQMADTLNASYSFASAVNLSIRN